MEKRSAKLPVSKGRYQSSCMWGLVDLFDFRNCQTNQKLLSNGRTVHKHGYEHSRKVDMPANFYKKCQGLEDRAGLGNHDADSFKTKLKDIIQEEKFPTEKQTKKLLKAMKQEDFGSIHQLANDHKKASKASKKVSKVSIDHRKEKVHLGNQRCSGSNELSLDSNNFVATLEEICCQIHQDGSCNGDMQRSITSSRSKQLDEISVQLLHMSAKAFIDQIYINRRYMSKNIASSKSKPFLDASEILQLNRDLFLKFLQDQNSLLAKQIQKLQLRPREEERTKYFLDSKSSESQRSGIRNPGSTMTIQKKKVNSLLCKNLRSPCGSSSKGNNNVANEIIILKPASKSKKNPENVSCHCSSSLQSHRSFKKEDQNIKSTYFSLKEMKRKFKQAVGESQKEHNLITLGGSLSKLSHNKHSLKYVDKGVNHSISAGESGVCSNAKSQEKQQKPVGLASRNRSEIDCNNEVECENMDSLTRSCSKQQQFDIFIEGKRHLSERFRDVNVAEMLPRKQSSRALKMVLSSSNHDFLVSDSSNRDISTANFRSDNQLEVSEIRPNIPENIDTENEVHKNSCAIGDDLIPSGYENILGENESMFPGSLSIFRVPHEPNMVGSTCCAPSMQATKLFQDNGYRNSSSQAGSSEDHGQKSLLEPSSSPLKISAQEIMDNCKYRDGHPSPVSVLDTFYSEDANSPTSITPKPDASPLQPRRIDFDDHSQVEIPHDPKTNITIGMNEEEHMSTYVKAIMQASYMNFEDLSATSPSLPHVPNTYAVDSLGLFQVESHCDLNLLLDCIHEVAVGVYHCYFGYSPWLSFLRPNIRPVPLKQDIVDEVVKEVNCYISPKLGQPTLDQLAGKDIAKSSSWLELRPDTEDIVIQIAEEVLEESMEDTILELQF